MHPGAKSVDMAGRYGNLNYEKLTKRSVVLGVSLFLIGALGEMVLHAVGLPVPGWENALLLGFEGLGILIALLSPFIFGIVLPLTE
jgi:hydrogenase/urease accessory protein HupE